MNRLTRTALLGIALLAGLSRVANASPVVFDNSAGTRNNGLGLAGQGFLAAISVDHPVVIDQIGVMTLLVTPTADFRFLIFDLATGNQLFATAGQTFVDDGISFKRSTPFAGFTLLPGVFYGIGYVSNRGTGSFLGAPRPFVQNGITAGAVFGAHVWGYSDPEIVWVFSEFNLAVELSGSNATAVPEPSSIVLVWFGVAAVGLGRLRGRIKLSSQP